MLNKIKGAKIAPFFMSDRHRLNVLAAVCIGCIHQGWMLNAEYLPQYQRPIL